jgi:hypothetical protein
MPRRTLLRARPDTSTTRRRQTGYRPNSIAIASLPPRRRGHNEQAWPTGRPGPSDGPPAWSDQICDEAGHMLARWKAISVRRSVTSTVTTLNRVNFVGPKLVEIATSAASRPRAITMRPIRRRLCRGSNVNHRPSRNTSNQAPKSVGAGSGDNITEVAGAVPHRRKDAQPSVRSYSVAIRT